MAITIVATPGAADANSYLTLNEAQALIDGMVENADVLTWGTASTDAKNRALSAATQRLDRERFLGARATDTQSLQWPRTGVRRPDTYINTYAIGFPFRITTDYFTDTEIPPQVQYAQTVLAVYLNANRDGLSLSGIEDYKSITIGSISVQSAGASSTASGADRVPPIFERYLVGLRLSGPGNISIRRS